MNKITKVNGSIINYRGFHFNVHRDTTFNGNVKSVSYFGLNGGMRNHYWNRAELKRSVDRRIDNAMKLYCEHNGMKNEDNPNLQNWLGNSEFKSYAK